jgi:Trypsin-like peptidase domain
MLIRLLIIAFICVNAANSFAWERPQISDMLQLSKIGLVKIIVTGLNNKQAVQDYGSGFVITPSGFVVSAAHLFPDTLQDLSITGWLAFLKNDDAAQRQNLSALTLVWKDLGLDVALLRFLEPPAGMRPLAVTSEPPKPGETLYVLGFPGGQNLSTAYPAVYQGSSTPSRFQFQGISNRGNSGGPILNAAGYVVGIVSETEDKINQTPITNTYRGVPTEKLPIPKGFSVSTVWPIYLSPDDLPGPSTSNNDLSKQSLSAESRACKISVPEAWNFRRSPELGFLVAPPTDSALLNAHFQFEFIVRKKEAYVEKLQTLLNSERFWPAPVRHQRL